ncbi:tRNA (guanosine(46)-N7)-methyltransferase TrmB [Mariniphaga anaerophila]|nr:tRNA (guanosine(46)-N7)-methyltransferase TrmB [Mariniphaga anaerophila]
MKGFEHVVQAPYNQVKNSDSPFKGKWGKEFFGNDNPIILELGCGKGEYSVELAEKNPDKNFLGVDIKGARLWKGAKIAAEKELKNVGFLRTNIEIIGQFFAPEEVDEIWLTFPDPQMKKTRKRLTSTFFLKRYQPFLKKTGVIHLKTDSKFQYSYTRALVHLNAFNVVAETDNLYESEILNDTLRIKTFYEKQWLSRGITIKYLAFQLNEKEWTEPETGFEKDEYRSFGRSARDL